MYDIRPDAARWPAAFIRLDGHVLNTFGRDPSLIGQTRTMPSGRLMTIVYVASAEHHINPLIDDKPARHTVAVVGDETGAYGSCDCVAGEYNKPCWHMAAALRALSLDCLTVNPAPVEAAYLAS